MAPNQGKAGGTGRKRPVGVWNRGRGSGPSNPIRVRTKRLDEIDGDKIALAYWLLAKQIVSDESDAALSEAEVRRQAKGLDNGPGRRSASSPASQHPHGPEARS